MYNFFIILGSLTLLLVCSILILLVLMQKPTENAGLGASLGSNIVESTLGGGASNVLRRWTTYALVLFFSLAFALSLLHVSKNHKKNKEALLPDIKQLVNAKPVAQPAKKVETQQAPALEAHPVTPSAPEATQQ